MVGYRVLKWYYTTVNPNVTQKNKITNFQGYFSLRWPCCGSYVLGTFDGCAFGFGRPLSFSLLVTLKLWYFLSFFFTCSKENILFAAAQWDLFSSRRKQSYIKWVNLEFFGSVLEFSRSNKICWMEIKCFWKV